MQEGNKKPQLFILVNNHFDPMWRRCWQRPLVFKGKTFISYNDIETYYLLDNITIAQQHPQYKFSVESVLVLRTILRDHPEVLPALKQLIKEGRFEVSGSGETIVDANMIHGESLVRNFVDGFTWLEDEFGIHSSIMLRNDSFGNSAQLPQIARACEIENIAGLFYSWPQGNYWRGLDGSTVLVSNLPVAAMGGDVIKYPPCETCNGTGQHNRATCEACGGRGIPSDLLAKLPGELDPEAFQKSDAALVLMGPEELLPNPALIDWAKAQEKTYDVHFALVNDMLPFAKEDLARLPTADESEFHPSIELNPNNAGVWVSRIKTKQIVRRQEQAMLALESLAVMAALKGQPYPQAAIKAIRQPMYFTMFHDAITATHVDAAYAELLDIMAEIDTGLTELQQTVLAELAEAHDSYSVINTGGHAFTGTVKINLPFHGGAAVVDETGNSVPAIAQDENGPFEVLVKELPAFSSRQFTVQPVALPQADVVSAPQEAEIENARFRVMADEHGLLKVVDKKLGKDILITDGYRPAEFILEHDEGSPWATLSPDFSRTPLAEHTHLLRVEKQESLQQMVFSIQPPFLAGYAGMSMKGELVVRLVEGLDRVEFDFKTWWSTHNHRLRVAMPVPKTGETARSLYEIPYGVLERQPYEPTFHWYGANGDWPAMHWAGIEQDGLSVAMFNRGTPSYLMEPGVTKSQVMFLSLLRSPAIPTYLHEPYFYTMTDYDGMRDEGDHAFQFAVTAYQQPFMDSPVVLDGECYQQTLPVAAGKVDLPEMPKISSENVRFTAVKWAEKADALILRLVEYRGKGGTVTITLPEGFRSVEQVNLMERQPQALAVKDGRVSLELRPWEITSLKLNR